MKRLILLFCLFALSGCDKDDDGVKEGKYIGTFHVYRTEVNSGCVITIDGDRFSISYNPNPANNVARQVYCFSTYTIEGNVITVSNSGLKRNFTTGVDEENDNLSQFIPLEYSYKPGSHAIESLTNTIGEVSTENRK